MMLSLDKIDRLHQKAAMNRSLLQYSDFENLCATARMAWTAPEELEKALRFEWWANHGCEISSRYADDGEMQCSECKTDFKRRPLAELRTHTMKMRFERMRRVLVPTESASLTGSEPHTVIVDDPTRHTKETE